MADESKKADVPATNPAVEEDLDDLDDVLDEFNKSSTTAKPVPASLPSSKSPAAAPAAASSSSSATAAPSSDTKAAVEDADDEDEDEDEDEDGENMPDLNEDELMRGFEEMMAAMGLGAPGAGAASTSSSGSGAKAGPSGAAAAPPADYAEAIRATMAKLRESDTNAASGSSSSSSRGAGADGMGMPSEDDLATIFSALGEGAMGDRGEEGPELAKMLDSMMGELLSKDILYEPLKELRDKYPEYFASPAASSISAEDRQRYEAQHRFVSQVVECFEDPIFENGTESEKKAKRAEVQELMDSMQECGQPPKEVVGDMPSELETLGLGGGGGDEQCCIQ